MNYLREINAFIYWLETNPLDAITQNLWFHLMGIANRCNWPEWFTVANITLQAKVGGVDKKTIIRHRNILIQKGRIEYVNQGKREAGKYHICSIVDVIGGNNPPNEPPNTPPKAPLKRPPKAPPLIKLNKTKLLFLDYVFLTKEEHEKLISQLGQTRTDEMIDRLNSYGHQKPKKFKEYESHYHTILAWVRKDGDSTKGKPNIPRGFQDILDYRGNEN